MAEALAMTEPQAATAPAPPVRGAVSAWDEYRQLQRDIAALSAKLSQREEELDRSRWQAMKQRERQLLGTCAACGYVLTLLQGRVRHIACIHCGKPAPGHAMAEKPIAAPKPPPYVPATFADMLPAGAVLDVAAGEVESAITGQPVKAIADTPQAKQQLARPAWKNASNDVLLHHLRLYGSLVNGWHRNGKRATAAEQEQAQPEFAAIKAAVLARADGKHLPDHDPSPALMAVATHLRRGPRTSTPMVPANATLIPEAELELRQAAPLRPAVPAPITPASAVAAPVPAAQSPKPAEHRMRRR